MSGAVCLSYVSIRFRTTSSRSSARMTSGVPHLSKTPAFFGGFMKMWYTVSSFGLTLRPVFRLISSSGSRKKFTAASSFVNFDNASACEIVRGKPSRMKPFFASGSFSRRSVIAITMSSGTSCPASMYAFAFFPRSVPCAALCRKKLPVEMCGTPRYAASFAAWVPLPAPGGPSKTSLISRRERSQRSKDFGPHNTLGSAARPNVPAHDVEGRDRGDVERGREEDRDVVVAPGHQDPAKDGRYAVRQAPDDRVHRLREPALFRRNNPHEERIADRRGHVHRGGAEEVGTRRGDRVRHEREAEHEDGREPLGHDDGPDGAVPLREGRAHRRGQADRHVGQGEEWAAPGVRHREFQEEPRWNERDEEARAQADQAVDARELEKRFPIHPLRTGLAGPYCFAVVPQEEVEGDRHDEAESVCDDERRDVNRLAAESGLRLNEREGEGQRKSDAREHVVQDERQGERHVPLLDRRLVRDDRVPRRQEGAFADAGDEGCEDHPRHIRRDGEHQNGRRQDRAPDQQEALPSAAVRVNPQGRRAHDHRDADRTEEETDDLRRDPGLREVRRDEDDEVAEPNRAKRVRKDDPSDFSRDRGEAEAAASRGRAGLGRLHRESVPGGFRGIRGRGL